MNHKEQIEGNKLIAEFMGFKPMFIKSLLGKRYEVIDFEHGRIKVENLDVDCFYHTSWDWLMPACHKWDNLNMYDKEGYEYEYLILCDTLDAKVSMYEIGPVWQQLVENIQWYNNQTPTK